MSVCDRKRVPAPAGPWRVYVLRCAAGTLYTGITNDLEERLRAHRAGRGAKYTRGRLPLELVYQEHAGSRGDATRRERQIKRLDREGKLALIAGFRAANSRPGARGRCPSGSRSSHVPLPLAPGLLE